jgi:hypothetical protein
MNNIQKNVFVQMLSGEVHTIPMQNGFCVAKLCIEIGKILDVDFARLEFFDENLESIDYLDYEDEEFIAPGDLIYVSVLDIIDYSTNSEDEEEIIARWRNE